MKCFSRIVTLILTVALFLSLAVPSAGAAFSDVSASKWYAADVNAMEQYGILNGTGNGKFSPDMSLTLAQAITMASRVHAYNAKNTIPAAAAGDQWYTPYLKYANDKGICSYGQYGTNYNGPCSRLIMAYLFADVFPVETTKTLNKVSEIPDVANTPANEGVYFLYEQGVLTGNDKYGTFAPDKSITRAETAAILHRVLNTAARKSYTLEKKPNIDLIYHDAAVACLYALMDAANEWGWGGFEYAKYDIDKNGTPELLVRTSNYPDNLVGIYTLKNSDVECLYLVDTSDAWYSSDNDEFSWGCQILTDGTVVSDFYYVLYPEDTTDNILSQFIGVEFWKIASNGYSRLIRESAVYTATEYTHAYYGSSTKSYTMFDSSDSAFKSISESYFDSLYYDNQGYAPQLDLQTLTWMNVAKG